MRLAPRWIAAWIVCSVALPAWSAEGPADKPAADKQEIKEPIAAKSSGDEAGIEFFERKIRPLLAQHCFSCHGRGQSKGGLSLASRDAMLAGGDSGTAVALGKPEESLLIEAVRYDGDFQMPPSGKLADEEIAALAEWLCAGGLRGPPNRAAAE